MWFKPYLSSITCFYVSLSSLWRGDSRKISEKKELSKSLSRDVAKMDSRVFECSA